MTKQATVIKIVSNQYTIFVDGKEEMAIAAGKLRKMRSPMVGDLVEIAYFDDAIRIEKILPRKNQLLRPSVANVDQALVITSLKDPDFSDHLLNRLLFLVELCDVKPIICITKSDLVDDLKTFEDLFSFYERMGYQVIYTHPGSDDKDLRACLQGKISVLCGQSGAGKSSLLNRLEPSFTLQTQAISKALGRGKHTTRYCHLHQVCDGWVADTPGFSSLDFSYMDISHLDQKIKAFEPWLDQCRFSDCKHVHEPGCAIKEVVGENKILESLYQDYCQIIEAKKEKW